MKKCPYCGEEIQDDAKKCRYCGEWLEGKATPNTEKKIDSKKDPNKSKRGLIIGISIPVVLLLLVVGLWSHFTSSASKIDKQIYNCENSIEQLAAYGESVSNSFYDSWDEANLSQELHVYSFDSPDYAIQEFTGEQRRNLNDQYNSFKTTRGLIGDPSFFNKEKIEAFNNVCSLADKFFNTVNNTWDCQNRDEYAEKVSKAEKSLLEGLKQFKDQYKLELKTDRD